MTRRLLVSILVFTSLFSLACASGRSSAQQAINDGAARWQSAFNAANVSELASMYAADAVLLPPNANALTGASISEYFVATFGAIKGASIHLSTDEIDSSGDIAYRRGTYTISMPDGSTIDRGKYIEVWRLRDGVWIMTRDIWNSSMPAPAPEHH